MRGFWARLWDRWAELGVWNKFGIAFVGGLLLLWAILAAAP